MSKLWLHIGSHKTGTTSTQKTFAASRDALRGAGLTYPWNRLWFAEDPGRKPRGYASHYVAEEAERRKLTESFDAMHEGFSGDEWIMSSELMSTLDRRVLGHMLEALSARFSDIRALMYVREPGDLVVSRTSQHIAMGNVTLEDVGGAGGALDAALFGALFSIGATTLLTTIALIRRGQIPLTVSSTWLVRVQEALGALGTALLVAGFVVSSPAFLNVFVSFLAVIVLVSWVFGFVLRRAVASAREDGGVGRMLAVLGDPTMTRWRVVHAPLLAALTCLATTRYLLIAYFAAS